MEVGRPNTKCRTCRLGGNQLFGRRVQLGQCRTSGFLCSLVYSFTDSDKPVFCSAILGSPSVIGGRSSLEISMLAAGGGWPVRQLPSSPRHRVTTLALIALALLLPLLVTIEEQVYISPAKPSNTAETPWDKLHFLASSLKGNLACSKYLHL